MGCRGIPRKVATHSEETDALYKAIAKAWVESGKVV